MIYGFYVRVRKRGLGYFSGFSCPLKCDKFFGREKNRFLSDLTVKQRKL